MANTTVIMDDGEPYIHLSTLIAHVREHGERASANAVHVGLVPGIASVLNFLESAHVNAILFDRQD